jgi:glycosyltransferase involved in cell wall biosynthesis
MKKPKKILQIINNLDIGGAEQLLVSTLSRFDKTRYRITVCCLEKTGPLEVTLRQQGFQVESFNIRSPFAPVGLFKLYRYIKKEKFSLVHTHLFKSDFLGGLTARIAGVPIWISTKHDEGTWMNPLVRFIDRKLSLIIDVIIADSHAVKSEAHKRGIPLSQIVVIHPSTIDRNDCTEQNIRTDDIKRELNLTPYHHLVGMVGRLHPVKGHDFFLASAKRVLQELPDTMFLVIGRGPLRTHLHNLSQELGLMDRILFIDYHKNLFEILGILDVVVLSSLSEGFPMVVLEAMAMGKPVVATDVGGVSEALEHGVTGILVPPQDSVALAEGILGILKDPKKINSMGQRGKERLLNAFTVNHMVNEIESIYQEPTLSRIGMSSATGDEQ